jgi:hypothetical protein
MSKTSEFAARAFAVMLCAWAADGKADAVTDWDVRSGTIVAESGLGTPPAIRVLALAHTAVYEAVNTITGRYPGARHPLRGPQDASVEAAVAAAHRATLMKLMPARQASIDAAYQSAFAALAAGPARDAGVAIGERAAAAVLASRGDDVLTPEAYRPHTTVGVYVPTASPAVPHWGRRKPWLMANASHFRPGPPPSLSGDAWARDYEEVRVLGARSSERRSAEQTAIARFWEYSLPPIYHGVVRSVATLPGREITRNARLYAAVTQAMDDAMIGVFDAKYHYNFWRPVTAIRNGDLDGHHATERDASWAPLADVPMHPEYPSAHSILAAAVGTVLRAEIGAGPTPMLGTASPTAKGAARHWTSIDDFVREVSDARIYEGIHFRTSTEVGVEMGERIGALAVVRYLALPRASVGPAVTGRGR